MQVRPWNVASVNSTLQRVVNFIESMHLFFKRITSANMRLTGIHSEPRKRVLWGSSIRSLSTRNHTNQHQVRAWAFLIDILKHVHRINNSTIAKIEFAYKPSNMCHLPVASYYDRLCICYSFTNCLKHICLKYSFLWL